MTTAQAIKAIEQEFKVSPIYARHVFKDIKTNHPLLADPFSVLKEAKKIVESKPKPFVKWVGGKRQLLKQFREMGLYPPEDFDPVKNSYFEPFVGGGAVFFDLLPEKAYLSDLNNELVITYNTIKNNVEDLIKDLKAHTHSKEYFLKIRSQKIGALTNLQIASRFIYLNRTAYNGMYRVNSKGEFNVPFGKYNNPLICDEKNLRKVSKALKDVSILHEDYKQAIKKAKKGDFVYFDPPYYPMSPTSSFTSYTKEDFSKEDQLQLRDTFLSLHKKGCFVMLSNSNAEFINKIYNELTKEGIKVHKVQAGRPINAGPQNRGKITEVLITNY